MRVHVDFAGPFCRKMWFIAVDAHSKLPEVFEMSSTTTARKVGILFTRYGIPEQLVSDNGPPFVSAEMESFLVSIGVKHIRSAPYHPASNGLAERFVYTFKRTMTAGHDKTCLEN